MPEDRNHWYIKVKHLIIMSLDSAKSGVYSEFSAPPLLFDMEMWLLHKIKYLQSTKCKLFSSDDVCHIEDLCNKHYQLWSFLMFEIPQNQTPLSYSKDCNLWFTITPTCLVQHETRPKGLLDPKIGDEMNTCFLYLIYRIFPTES